MVNTVVELVVGMEVVVNMGVVVVVSMEVEVGMEVMVNMVVVVAVSMEVEVVVDMVVVVVARNIDLEGMDIRHMCHKDLLQPC
jgi:hypothetical protein